MKRQYLAILCLCAIALFVGCENEKTPAIETNKYGYEFHVPEGWSRVGHTDRASADNEVFFIKSEDG